MRFACLLLLTVVAATSIACGGGGGGGGPGGTPGPGGPGPQIDPVLGPDVRINTDTPGAELSLIPEICCDDGALYVTWYDRRNGDLDVYFNASEDGGETWRPRDVRLDTDVAGAWNAFIWAVSAIATLSAMLRIRVNRTGPFAESINRRGMP